LPPFWMAPWPLPLLHAGALAAASAILFLLARSDLRSLRLPNALTAAYGALGLLLSSVAPLAGQSPAASAAGALSAALPLLLLRARMSKRTGRQALGLGDVKLAAACGIWLGPFGEAVHLLLSVVLALLLLAVLGGLRLRRGLDPLRAIPFGPALCLAAAALIAAQACGVEPSPAFLISFWR